MCVCVRAFWGRGDQGIGMEWSRMGDLLMEDDIYGHEAIDEDSICRAYGVE